MDREKLGSEDNKRKAYLHEVQNPLSFNNLLYKNDENTTKCKKA